MRLHLRGLFQRHRSQDRGATQPVHTGRQRNHPHAQVALCRVWRHPGHGQSTGKRGSSAARRDAPGDAVTDARQPRRDRIRVAHQTQQKRFQQGDLAHRSRSRRVRHHLHRRRFARHFRPERTRTGRCRHRRAQRAARLPDRGPHLARRPDRQRLARHGARYAVPAHLLHHRRRAAAESARRWHRAAIRTAMPRPSMSSRRWKNSPASGPIRRPLSKRSIRCSRGSIPSRRRPKPRPAASR